MARTSGCRLVARMREGDQRAWLTGLVPLLLGCAPAQQEGLQLPRETALDGLSHIEARELSIPDVQRLDDSLALKRLLVDVGSGVHLYVIEEGSGLPPLVLVNGGPGNTLHSFLPHFSAAARFARVIYYDQRGTGRSDWVPGPSGYSTAQAVEDLEALRIALGIDRWIVLGHSYGGLVAQWYAMRYPERLLGMILVGSSVPVDGLELGERDYRSAEERRRIREVYAIQGQPVLPVHSQYVDLETLQRMIFNGYINGDWKRQYFFKPSRERMAQIARYEWVHDRDFNSEVRQDGFARDLRGVFRDFPIPTLIVEGVYDANWGPAKPQRFAAEHPNAKLVIIDGAAHFPFAAQPDTFFARLEEFMRALPSISSARIAQWKHSVSGR